MSGELSGGKDLEKEGSLQVTFVTVIRSVIPCKTQRFVYTSPL